MRNNNYSVMAALQDFRRARHQAALETFLARLSGKSADLLVYEDVRRQLRATNSQVSLGLRDIPLDAIVGSVGRSTDFTRRFLPKNPSDADRWTRVQAATGSMLGVPPIEVYQLGDAYFVLDGNHRVSVARQAGARTIQAYVYHVPTPVPLAPTDQPNDILLKGEYAEFLTQTGLLAVRPDADLTMTVPGQYATLVKHIKAHHATLHPGQPESLLTPSSIADWYDSVYLPVIQLIREQGLLHEFPGRTETDLYVSILEHHAALVALFNSPIRVEAAAADFVAQRSPQFVRTLQRVRAKLTESILPELLADGPPSGQWRAEHEADDPSEHLFADILVPISGEPRGWIALEQALTIAQREAGSLYGLHVVRDGASPEQPMLEALQTAFAERCAAAGIRSQLAIDAGRVADRITGRARWVDLVVVHLEHPPAAQPLERLRSGFRALVRRCPRPILAVPHASQLQKAVLAYDGSTKSKEALFAAAYFAHRWQMALVIVTVLEKGRTVVDTQLEAQQYLTQHGVQATYVVTHGPVADAIMDTGDAHGCDLAIIGGYGLSPVAEAVFGSTVDHLLRARWQPLLICR